MSSFRVTVPLLLCAIGPAQAKWLLPPHGFARYQHDGPIVATMADGKRLQILEGVSTQCQPVLFADELAAGDQRWAVEPWSLDAIPLALAWDVSTWQRPGRIDVTWPRVAEYGEVRFVGAAKAVDGDGWQVIQGRLSRREIAPLPGEKDAEFLRIERHYMQQALDGTLSIRRRFDGERGVVREFTWTIDADLTVGDARKPGKLAGSETWTLVEVVGNRDPGDSQWPGFAAQVQEAVDTVSARLLRDLAAPSGSLAAGERRGSVHGPSQHAAMLYGLARAGRRVGDPAIDAALAALLQRPQSEPHGHALTILAIVDLHAEPTSRAAWARSQPPTVVLPSAMRAEVDARVQALMRLARRQGETGAMWWAFATDVDTPSPFHTWISVLALDAAARAGAGVPADAFEAAVVHLLAAAVPAGPGDPVVLEPETAQPAATSTRPGGSVPMLCWADRDERRGSMGFGGATVGAMAAMLCCRRHLREPELREGIDAAVRGGWSWLARHWTPRHGPARLQVHRQWRAETVLALAFLFDETNVRWLDGRDLYFEVATVLQNEQPGRLPNGTVLDWPAALALWRPQGAAVVAPITPARK